MNCYHRGAGSLGSLDCVFLEKERGVWDIRCEPSFGDTQQVVVRCADGICKESAPFKFENTSHAES